MKDDHDYLMKIYSLFPGYKDARKGLSIIIVSIIFWFLYLTATTEQQAYLCGAIITVFSIYGLILYADAMAAYREINNYYKIYLQNKHITNKYKD